MRPNESTSEKGFNKSFPTHNKTAADTNVNIKANNKDKLFK